MNAQFTPTEQQTKAADPTQSVWVTANAGSGKTHVLVERVIRILLEGAEPATILCITFTKAAATEMSSRLFDRLSTWTSLSDENLTRELKRIGLSNPQPNHLLRARRLFTLVLETPGGLKIQTIHAFCERLLQLFPVEAGMAPGFRVLDERSSLSLREQAQKEILAEALKGKDRELAEAFSIVAANAASDTFDSLIKTFMGASQNIKQLLVSETDPDALSLVLKNRFGLGPSETSLSIFQKIEQLDEPAYQFHADILRPHMPYDGHDAAQLMTQAITHISTSEILRDLFFTKDKALKPRKKLMAVNVSKKFPESAEFISNEQARLLNLFQNHDLLLRIEATRAIFIVARAINKKVENKKRQLGSYDFDDLIRRTSDLLHNSQAAQWVLYKLDSGLNHILLDEAQDTSPAQWSIIHALAEEFFAGSGRPQTQVRTIFVVGDRKQSIYSFQGADAESFAIARSRFTDFIKSKGSLPAEIELNISYRSTKAVLDAVNLVFPASNPQRFGFLPKDIFEHDHTTNRIGVAGRVEVWPLFLNAVNEDDSDHWLAPIDREPAQSPKRRLAKHIAETLKSWIGFRKLESKNRLVEPGDVMILMQSRGTLFSMLISELRKIGVPVAGADRLRLRDSIVVQDLLVLAQWILLPQDDYALACVLKSPFVPLPLDENQLFELAHYRGTNSLWQKLCEQENKNAQWLENLSESASELTPYAFFSKILVRFRKAMLIRLGPEAGDAIDAFLDQVLSHEIEFGPTLAGFLHWFNAGETEIKRELEKSTGEVRLMTVHGAKGLEANIVFLPDAASVPKGRDSSRVLMIVDNQSDVKLPLWMIGGLSDSANLEMRKEEVRLKEGAERNRLLYVAMTRARDELYICGAKGKSKDVPKDSWYAIVEPILGITPFSNEFQNAESLELFQPRKEVSLPAWIFGTVSDEKGKATLAVTQTSTANAKAEELKRGTSVHNLLQSLPTIAPEKQLAFAQTEALRLNLDRATAISLVELINMPEFEMFFGPNSQAEVEISGFRADGSQVNGRIDRLVEGSAEITLLDYKSDRFVPDSIEADNPYMLQILAYAELVKAAYPDHSVKAALLWTQNARLDWLPLGSVAQDRDNALNIR